MGRTENGQPGEQHHQKPFHADGKSEQTRTTHESPSVSRPISRNSTERAGKQVHHANQAGEEAGQSDGKMKRVLAGRGSILPLRRSAVTEAAPHHAASPGESREAGGVFTSLGLYQSRRASLKIGEGLWPAKGRCAA